MKLGAAKKVVSKLGPPRDPNDREAILSMAVVVKGFLARYPERLRELFVTELRRLLSTLTKGGP